MKEVEKYIGKWYTFKVCGDRIIILVTGYDDSNTKYEGAHFVGKKTIILSNGSSANFDWACEANIFFDRVNENCYKEFEF